ncbi:MAG TPA: transglycosylase SLT domain-containing protein [Gemmatimonadaceae bacterium]|nr:transglycosylase SLT domain-containing protein [Gemmatimonadaceae bacterium]
MTGDRGSDRRTEAAPPAAFLAPRSRKTDRDGAPGKRECLAWYCRSAARLAARGLAGIALLAAGTVFAITRQPLEYARPGELLSLPVAVVQPSAATARDKEISRVSRVLRLHTRDTLLADRIARAFVIEGGKKNIDPALLIGVLLTEDATLEVHARSSVGARGLMQIMPFHSGKYGCASPDLYDVEANICHGVAILAEYMGRTKTVEKALLRYNGCVRGRNTPNCHTYPNKVLRYSRTAASQMVAGLAD